MANRESFPPIVSESARVLILGSMPGEESLRKNQYYGHPRNAFWFIMGELFGAYPNQPYQQRINILMENRIAVWDVLKTCYRKGSLDSDIEKNSIEINDFYRFFDRYSLIRQVFFNGGTAEGIYKKYVLANLNEQFDHLHYHRLPSTSPAHASLNFEQKKLMWNVLKQAAQQ